MSGQLAVEVFASAPNEFFFKVAPGRISFVKEGSGPATALILHQSGVDVPMPRVDTATAQQLAAELKTRIQSQTALPGSEAAVRLMIEGHISGNPPYARMTPQLARIVRDQRPHSDPVFKQLGALQSIEFKGVGSMGMDKYEVKFENGTMQYHISVAADGTINGALMTMSP